MFKNDGDCIYIVFASYSIIEYGETRVVVAYAAVYDKPLQMLMIIFSLFSLFYLGSGLSFNLVVNAIFFSNGFYILINFFNRQIIIFYKQSV